MEGFCGFRGFVYLSWFGPLHSFQRESINNILPASLPEIGPVDFPQEIGL